MDTLVSFYMRTPSGFDIEFGAGSQLLDDDFVQVNPSHSEVWGHKARVAGLGTNRRAPVGRSPAEWPLRAKVLAAVSSQSVDYDPFDLIEARCQVSQPVATPASNRAPIKAR
jgi:hypothetical protein